MVARELCVLCRNAVWVFTVKYKGFQPLGAYSVEQTVCNRDSTDTDNLTRMWTPHKREFRPVWQLRKQTQEASILWIRKQARVEGIQGFICKSIHARRWLTTGRRVARWHRYDKSLLYSFSCLWNLERWKWEHPTACTIWCLTAPLQPWGGLMTHSAWDSQRNPKHLRFQWATEWHEYSLPASSDRDAIHI